MDMMGAAIGLLIFSPFFVLIALYIKCVSPGSVFFRQERIGFGGKSFHLLKFRTMHQNVNTKEHEAYLSQLIRSELSGDHGDLPMFKKENPSQIIPFGKILRNTCLDEIPQLINVFRGEMSLIGPRPPIPYEVKEYLQWHNHRFDSLPGMTGLWQVSGKNNLSFREMIRLDIRYSNKISFLLDMKILLRTPQAIIMNIRDKVRHSRQ
jgi:lipopolysaccharide/colanic/teichoic acid biosynthesis glycosyltransferase